MHSSTEYTPYSSVDYPSASFSTLESIFHAAEQQQQVRKSGNQKANVNSNANGIRKGSGVSHVEEGPYSNFTRPSAGDAQRHIRSPRQEVAASNRRNRSHSAPRKSRWGGYVPPTTESRAEAVRAALEARQRAAQMLRLQQEEVRALDIAERTQRKHGQQAAYQHAQQRSYDEAHDRLVRSYDSHGTVLEQRRQEQAAMNAARINESSRRAHTAAARLAESAEQQEYDRERLRANLEMKGARVEERLREKERMREDVNALRHAAMEQEALIRSSVEWLKHSGHWEEVTEQLSSSLADAMSPRTLESLGISQTLPRKSLVAPRASTAGSVTSASNSTSITATSNGNGAKVAERDPYTSKSVVHPTSRRENELQVLLKEEVRKEVERQQLLSTVTNEKERARLIKIFAIEREGAKERIMALTNEISALYTPQEPSLSSPHTPSFVSTFKSTKRVVTVTV